MCYWRSFGRSCPDCFTGVGAGAFASEFCYFRSSLGALLIMAANTWGNLRAGSALFCSQLDFLLSVARNPANGFPARLLGSVNIQKAYQPHIRRIWTQPQVGPVIRPWVPAFIFLRHMEWAANESIPSSLWRHQYRRALKFAVRMREPRLASKLTSWLRGAIGQRRVAFSSTWSIWSSSFIEMENPRRSFPNCGLVQVWSGALSPTVSGPKAYSALPVPTCPGRTGCRFWDATKGNVRPLASLGRSFGQAGHAQLFHLGDVMGRCLEIQVPD